MQRPADLATGRLMPSLRCRRDVELDEVVWRPVLADQTPAELPIVVCGIDGESTFGMIRREALGRPPEQALEEALHNLAEERVRCDAHELGELPIVIVSGSFYAAEKLLDRAFMQTLHHRLDAELLAAATPARGCLIVAAATHDAADLARFSALVRTRHDKSGGRSISPSVLLVEHGRIVGYVHGPGERAEPIPRADTVPDSPGPAKKLGFLRRLFGRK